MIVPYFFTKPLLRRRVNIELDTLWRWLGSLRLGSIGSPCDDHGNGLGQCVCSKADSHVLRSDMNNDGFRAVVIAKFISQADIIVEVIVIDFGRIGTFLPILCTSSIEVDCSSFPAIQAFFLL